MGASIGPKIGIDGEREYRKQLQNIIQQTKTLDAQMAALESSFDDEADALKNNEKQTELLLRKKEALEAQVEAMKDMVERSSEATGENSTQTLKWQESLAKAQSQLNATTQELDATAGAEAEVGEGASGMSSIFGGAISGMVTAVTTGDIMGALSAIVGVANEISQASYDMQVQFDETVQAIVAGTGLTGEALEEVKEKAEEAWAMVADVNGSMANSGSITGELMTRFGWTKQEAALKGATAAVEAYAKATGEDGTEAVSKMADVMMQFGLYSDDAAVTTENLYGMMDKMAKASTLADLSLDDMTGFLTDNKSAMEAMGMSMDDAISLMINFRQAGGDINTLSSGMEKAFSKLNETTDDLGATWDQATMIMGGFGDASDKLNQTIGVTGVTIEDAFGKKNAQALISTFTTMRESTRDWSAEMADASGKANEMYAASIGIEDGWAQFQAIAQTKWGIPTGITDLLEKVPMVKEKIAEAAAEASKDTAALVGSVDEYGISMSKDADAVGEAMSKMEQDAKTSVQNMKNTLDQTIPGPKIQVTELVANMTSGGITWTPTTKTYAKGYSSPVLLNGATVFGSMGGSLLSGGEYGTEVVVGESYLLNAMTSAVQRAFGYIPSGASSGSTTTYGDNNVNVSVYGAPGQDVRDLARLVGDQINKATKARIAVRG